MKFRSIYSVILIIAVPVFFSACKKSQVFDNPYAGGQSPLNINVSLITPPTPVSGNPGTQVTFAATGLLPYKDQLVFSFNGTPATVTGITATGITVQIPTNASTGVTTIAVGNQIFFGPRFQVSGKISVDPTFTVISGANNTVNNALSLPQFNGKIVYVGAFTDYDYKAIITPINHLTRAYKDGPMDLSFNGGGTDGQINSIIQLGTNYFIAGSFGGYFFNNYKSVLTNMSNITRLNANFGADSVVVNPYLGTGKARGVPAFNGSTNGPISKLFASQGKVVAIGNFGAYFYNQYSVPFNKPETYYTTMPQVVRFNTDGSLDSTYNYDLVNHTGLAGGNGSVTDGYMQADGKLVLVGNFTKWDSIAAGHIVRLNTDGTVDQTFNTGAGTDKIVTGISFNSTTNRFIICGSFSSYNGTASSGLAMLNPDGSMDNSFVSKGFTPQGLPSFARQLSNGLIVVSGSFTSYANYRRSGFMILNPTGDLATDYNCIGDFKGYLKDLFESTNSQGQLTITLMGNFSQIDGLPAYNVTRLVLTP